MVDVPQHPGWSVLPRTAAGWWAVALLVAFACAVAVTTAVDLDANIGQLNLRGTINLLLLLAAGAAALYALLLRGERSVMVVVPILLAVLAVGFEIAEAIVSSD
jgi:hypothetical protein